MDKIIVIDFSKQVNYIQNFSRLPAQIQEVIHRADLIYSEGFQELCGSLNQKLIWSAGGYINEPSDEQKYNYGKQAQFVLNSIGWKDKTGHWCWTQARGVVSADEW